MNESGEADTEFSNIYFFLPSITDRNEEINKYQKNVSISPIGITQQQLNNWVGVDFNPAKLDLFRADKAIMSAAVAECLRHMDDISSSNIGRNSEALLSTREVEVPVDRIIGSGV